MKNHKKIPSIVNPSFRYRLIKQGVPTAKIFKDDNIKTNVDIFDTSRESEHSNSVNSFLNVSEQNHLVRVSQPYEFKTKQRPFEFTYFSRDIFNDLATVGENVVVPFYQVNSRKMLLINYLKVDLFYRQQVAGPPARAWYTEYPSSFTGVLEASSFDLSTTTTKLYDARSERAYSGSLEATQGSYTTFGENVLDNGSSSTTLYAFENTALVFKLFYVVGADLPYPTADTTGISYRMSIRGHLTTMSDYFEMLQLKK